MNLDQLLALTQELIYARGPVGQEDEVREIMQRELAACCDEVRLDEAGNVVGTLRGREKRAAPPTRIMAHMDELALIVKRIEPDGTLRVRALGAITPWVFGLGHVEIMADTGVLPGVLGVGCMHTTRETPAANRSVSAERGGEGRSLEWPQVHVFTRMSPAELSAAGVHPGTRVVLTRAARTLRSIGDCVAGYFLDDRVCLAAMIGAATLLRAASERPPSDILFIATCQEEIGGGSAAYAARTAPGSLTVALDIAPVAQEYGTALTAQPIVVYRDRDVVFDRSVADSLVEAGRQLGQQPQQAVLESYASDASAAKKSGNTARCGLLCIPTEFTHGCEIVVKQGVDHCARLLAAYLSGVARK